MKTKRARLAAAIAMSSVTLLMMGCPPPAAQVNREYEDKCAVKASFEMSCPRESLTFTCLQNGFVSAHGFSGIESCIQWGVTLVRAGGFSARRA
jgi:uncharacterized heparinase superfamily protein